MTRMHPRCRHELYHGYKGHRTPMPDEIRETLPRLYDLVRPGPGQAHNTVAGPLFWTPFTLILCLLVMHPPASATAFQ